jgi:phospholipase C
LPLVVVSPYARQNYVDSSVLDQTSITRFIEDNWGLGRIANGSFDAIANDMSSMFNFNQTEYNVLILDSMTGRVVDIQPK